MLVVTMAAASRLAVLGDGEIAATAEPVSVDMRAGRVSGVVGTANLRYSPLWAATNASVRIEAVYGGTTNVIKTGVVDEEGVFAWTQPDAANPVYRLLLWTMRNGVAVGEPLSAFVSFGFRSAAESATVADTRTNSLALVVGSGAPVGLTYSTEWVEDASAIEVCSVRLSGREGTPLATNMMFSAAADAEGVTPMRGVGRGWWRLLCRLTDSSGGILDEYLTGEFQRKGGFVLDVR